MFSRRGYWRAMNVFARVVGIWWLAAGIFFILLSIYYMFALAPPGVDYFLNPSIDYGMSGALVAVIGVAFLRIKPYRPDLERIEDPCSWWTGDKSSSS